MYNSPEAWVGDNFQNGDEKSKTAQLYMTANIVDETRSLATIYHHQILGHS